MKKHFPVFSPADTAPIYLDSAASTQVPQSVLDAVSRYISSEHSNIHRSAHFMGERATGRYDEARTRAARFLNAPKGSQIVFLSGTTQAANFIAHAYALQNLKRGDIITTGPLEHHSNYLPWLQAAKQGGFEILPYALDAGNSIDVGSIPFDNPRLKLIAVTHVSNVTGAVQPVQAITEKATAKGIPVFVDGAQAVAHLNVDLSRMPAAFFAFSGHKMHALTGIGVCCISPDYVERVGEYMTGGGMVAEIAGTSFRSLPPPFKWEAGTPNNVGAVSLKAAMDFIDEHGLHDKLERTDALLAKAAEGVAAIGGFRIHSRPENNAGILSFSHESIHPHDLASLLSESRVCIRAGHHCAKPMMELLGEKATCRLSLGCYNDEEDIRHFLQALKRAVNILNQS